jgi:hypothetical protein
MTRWIGRAHSFKGNMQTRTRIQDPNREFCHIHLAASGAPTLEVDIEFADQASQVFSAYREKYGFGASGMKHGCGNIYDSGGKLVGSISYNGRIWDASGRLVE